MQGAEFIVFDNRLSRVGKIMRQVYCLGKGCLLKDEAEGDKEGYEFIGVMGHKVVEEVIPSYIKYAT